ncbi:helix-turn-helix transcriptional regulator [Shimia sp. R9_1]|uniref:helix-turn-helix domain-containing protein n=1 Tax=Shimia sp. R9_1 TaxID=2821111 RepID=UPI001AD9E6F9|nr:helix-turn-helix transcriptional regulator [Shimia sp. R9_1]MBO9407844.1 helix-turn-helix transcriptional regulator [Shimia sp. R9_1]
MTASPTAEMLAQAIDASEMTQKEIADQIGMKNANVISMMKQGITRIPLSRIPALSETLQINAQTFLMTAIEEYHPTTHEVLADVLGLPLSETEMRLLDLLRTTEASGFIDVIGPLWRHMERLLELVTEERT